MAKSSSNELMERFSKASTGVKVGIFVGGARF